ncbi:MAG: CCA tRNA nucleotidyltransferase, partial [Pseudomonadota bacterium]
MHGADTDAEAGDAAPGRRIDAPWLRGPAAQAVISALAGGGARALFVGGCVRNALLDVAVSDLDIATDAEPQDVQRLLEAAGIRHVPTGIEHGTVTAIAPGRTLEITTFRQDVETDGRHARVRFGRSLEEDARRRDFTMNALYAEADGTVLDPLDEGLADLARRRVRFIGDPARRIAEDRLRILRFYRFHALYGDAACGLDAAGQEACAEAVAGLDDLARERVGAEMRKLLDAVDPGPALAGMDEAGALARVLPGAATAGIAPLVATEALAGASPDWKRRLLALGIAPEDAVEPLRLSRAEQRGLRAILAAQAEARPAAQTAYRHGAEAARDAALLAAAATAVAPPRGLLRDAAKGAMTEFPISADDLIARGMKPGKALGDRL